MGTKTTFWLSRIFAALGITAIPTAYIAVCIACYELVGWWLPLAIILLTIFLPVQIFQIINARKYRDAVEELERQKAENEV